MLVATSMPQDSIELSVYTFAIMDNFTTLIDVYSKEIPLCDMMGI